MKYFSNPSICRKFDASTMVFLTALYQYFFDKSIDTSLEGKSRSIVDPTCGSGRISIRHEKNQNWTSKNISFHNHDIIASYNKPLYTYSYRTSPVITDSPLPLKTKVSTNFLNRLIAAKRNIDLNIIGFSICLLIPILNSLAPQPLWRASTFSLSIISTLAILLLLRVYKKTNNSSFYKLFRQQISPGILYVTVWLMVLILALGYLSIPIENYRFSIDLIKPRDIAVFIWNNNLERILIHLVEFLTLISIIKKANRFCKKRKENFFEFLFTRNSSRSFA